MSTEDANSQEQAAFFSRHRGALATAASGFVGALALATSTYNVFLQRQQVSAQVWPQLELMHDWTDSKITLAVANQGVGPAIVKRVRVAVDGELQTDWVHAMVRLTRRQDLPHWTTIEEIQKTITPGQAVSMVAYDDADLLGAIVKERNRLTIELCYCSVLGECWTVARTGFRTNLRKEVTACPADARPFAMVSDAYLDRAIDALVGPAPATRAEAGASP